MRDEQKRGLPSIVRSLVDEIEAGTGAEVLAERGDPAYGRGMSGFLSFTWPPHLEINYRETLADVGAAYPEPYHQLTHELLHMRRYFLDRVPAVYKIEGMADSLDSRLGGLDVSSIASEYTALGIESALEHIFIENRIGEMFGWSVNQTCLKNWEYGTHRPQWINPHLTGWLLMLQWLKARFQNAEMAIRQRADEVMVAESLLAQAEALGAAVREALAAPDPIAAKERLVLAACRAFGVPPPAVRLMYCQPEAPPAFFSNGDGSYTDARGGCLVKRLDCLFPGSALPPDMVIEFVLGQGFSVVPLVYRFREHERAYVQAGRQAQPELLRRLQIIAEIHGVQGNLKLAANGSGFIAFSGT